MRAFPAPRSVLLAWLGLSVVAESLLHSYRPQEANKQTVWGEPRCADLTAGELPIVCFTYAQAPESCLAVCYLVYTHARVRVCGWESRVAEWAVRLGCVEGE